MLGIDLEPECPVRRIEKLGVSGDLDSGQVCVVATNCLLYLKSDSTVGIAVVEVANHDRPPRSPSPPQPGRPGWKRNRWRNRGHCREVTPPHTRLTSTPRH